jgi:hypothetical protein
MSANRVSAAFAVFVALSLSAQAQVSLSPAELPSAEFQGREYVDSRGCVFLRSTFGGEVTWVPRFGADRQPICNGQATTATATPATPATSDVATTTTTTTTITPAAAAPAPAAAPQPVGQVRAPVAVAERRDPPRRAAAPARKPKPKARSAGYRGPDADGRHPACPLNAQYGRLVRMDTGKIMVMCVMSPELFPEAATEMKTAAHAPKASGAEITIHPDAPRKAAPRGSHLQIGSFSVPANAHRVQAHMQAQGIPVHLRPAGRLTVVTAGPFADQAQAHAAMSIARGLGIRDAFFR